MSLINYVESADPGSLILALGSLMVMFVVAYLIWRLGTAVIKWVEMIYNKDHRYAIIEEKMLNDIATEKGIDIDKELLNRSILTKRNKSFRKKLEEEMYKKMFGELEEA